MIRFNFAVIKQLFIVVALAMLSVACSKEENNYDRSAAVLRRNIDRVSSMDPIKAESAVANRAVALVYEIPDNNLGSIFSI